MVWQEILLDLCMWAHSSCSEEITNGTGAITPYLPMLRGQNPTVDMPKAQGKKIYCPCTICLAHTSQNKMLRGEIHCGQAQRFSGPGWVKNSWLSLQCKKAPGPQCCLSILPGCSCSQTHTCAERGARNFLSTLLISGIFPLCLYLCWTKGSQGFKLITWAST